jgi:hypothetical protein
MTGGPTVLAVLLENRGLHRYGGFCAAYQKAARSVDEQLARSVPSRAQFHRWITGDVRSLPHTDHCRVLEHMLAGYSAAQLFRICTNGQVPSPARTDHQAQTRTQSASGFAVPESAGTAGVASVFTSRSEFMAAIHPRTLFEGTRRIRTAGLSLNMITQQVPDQQIRTWLADGGELACLFLDPDGQALQVREQEEGYPPGRLSALTKVNIDVMVRLRDRVPADAQDRLHLAVYDETIRFNILLVDDHICVAQPYLPSARGIDSPTLVVRAMSPPAGLYPVFEHAYEAIAERSRPV